MSSRVGLPPSPRRSILMLLLGLCALTRAAGATRPIGIDDLIAARVPGPLSLSPDGRRVVFALRTYDAESARYVRQLHLLSLPDGATRQLTHRDEGAADPRFSPDGTFIAFLSPDPSGETAGGTAHTDADDEASFSQVLLLPVAGGEARHLTHLPRGVTDYAWIPDGSGLIVLAEEEKSPAERTLAEKDLDARNDGVVESAEVRRLQFWSVEREDGTARRINEGDYGVEPPFAVAPDGRSVVYSTNLTGAAGGENAFDLYVLDVAAGSSRRLTSRAGSEKQVSLSPDGRLVAFVAPAIPEVSFSRPTLFVVPVGGGEPRPLGERSDRDIDEDDQIHWSPDGKGILAVVHRGTDGPIWRFDVAGGEGRELVGGRRTCASPVAGMADGRAGRLVFVNQGPTEAPEIHVAALDGSGVRQVGSLNPQTRDWEIAPSEVIRWKSADGREVEGILVRPRDGKAGARVPLLVYPHGGPQWRDPNILLDDRQAYAAQGYAVLLVEFRGSTGYGNAWETANLKDLGGGDFQDLMTGVDKVIALGVADPERLGIFGGSYGGYMTNWAITQTDRFKGAVSWYGIWNLVSDYSNSFYSQWEPDYLRAHYWDDWDLYLSRSPARFVRKVKTPVLILHGEADDNTNLSNSREMWTALRQLGKPVEFVHYPREGHGFEEPSHQRDVFNRTLRHMDRYVKGGGTVPAGPGETVADHDLELQIARVAREESFAGRRPAAGSVFLSVTLLLKDRRPAPKHLALRIGGAASEVHLVDAAGKIASPLGALAESLGETIQLTGGGEIAIEPDDGGAASALPAVLVFEVSASAGPYRLRVGSLPPVAFAAPPPEAP
ncbi:MAG TPA: S9 family peptidase [Candidatus Polarisedimenticolia bacterium]|nr:S9 family peptidase [Candidatus Polarisedimenticolia bacterium]